MPVVKNSRVYLASVPEGYPKPGKDIVHDESATIDLDNVPLEGGLLVKTLVLSIDPWQRGKMRDASTVGKSLFNYGVGRVLRSEVQEYKAGDIIEGFLNFEEYNILPSTTKLTSHRIIKNEQQLPLSTYVGVAGMPGKTAYYAWKEYSKTKQGETVFVTTAGGAVGSLVVQLAKQDGLKVIASSGSDDKVEWVKELGADVSFNYKTTDTVEVLAKEGPINVYWENVGGKTLDDVINAAAPKARFLLCGFISLYNDTKPQELYNIGQLLYKNITLHGFVWTFLQEQYHEEFDAVVPKLVKEGKLKFKEEINKGLGSVGEVLLAQQQGKNHGKPVIIVAED